VSNLDELAALARAGAAFVRVAGREKRPVGGAWQTRATDDLDAVEGWLRAGANVGILLGAGGLIDVECDDADAEIEVEALRLPTTVSWSSARGAHRLYRLAEPLPDRAVVKVGAIEVRLGGRAAQSVLPPSIHPTGVAYRWTAPPSAVEVAEITLADLLVG
jgi:microcystin degradation protein MlrC